MQVRLILHANDPIINRKTRLLNFVKAVYIIVLREFVFVTVLISSFFSFTLRCADPLSTVESHLFLLQQILCIILLFLLLQPVLFHSV